MSSSILPRFSPARLTTVSPMMAVVERTLGWVSTVMLDMMYLLLVITRASPDRSAQYRECVSELAVTSHFEKVAQPVPSPRPPKKEGGRVAALGPARSCPS